MPSAIPISAWLSPPESRGACTANTGSIKKSPSMRRANSDASERLARNSNGDMQGASGLRGKRVELAGGARLLSVDPFEQRGSHQRGDDGHQDHDEEQRRSDEPFLQADVENDQLHISTPAIISPTTCGWPQRRATQPTARQAARMKNIRRKNATESSAEVMSDRGKRRVYRQASPPSPAPAIGVAELPWNFVY